MGSVFLTVAGLCETLRERRTYGECLALTGATPKNLLVLLK